MNAEEQQMITGLFDRLRAYGPIEKDPQAEQLIMTHARQNPDAGYMLVQNVLVQEHVMTQQQQQIEQLQTRVAELESMQSRGMAPAAAAPAGGGFLGGLFGGGRSSSVPPMGRPAAPQPTAYNAPPAAPSSPWGRRGAAAGPMGGQAGYGQAPMQQPAPGGGFMRSAMATAAGVAGGMLVAGAISNMMTGGTGSANASPAAGGEASAAADSSATSSDNSFQETSDAGSYDDNDPGNFTETADTSWDGGGDVEL